MKHNGIRSKFRPPIQGVPLQGEEARACGPQAPPALPLEPCPAPMDYPAALEETAFQLINLAPVAGTSANLPTPSAGPPLAAPPVDISDRLVAVQELPYPFQACYQWAYFNRVQSDCFTLAYETDENFVVAAPTASGKTGVVELAILRMLRRSLTPSGGLLHQPGLTKAVYVAPMRALVQEKMRSWGIRFKGLGINLFEMTGDTDYVGKGVSEADVILTTPEKFDAVTRRNQEKGNVGWVGDIALVVLDEVHLLGEKRGCVLEAIVSRLKLLQMSSTMEGLPLSYLRLGAVSATVPNADDVAAWLGAPPHALRVYGEEMRPVKLEINVRGYKEDRRGPFMFEKTLGHHVFGVLESHFRRGASWQWKPTLVFCSTRKGTAETAGALVTTLGQRGVNLVRSAEQRRALQAAAQQVQNKALSAAILQGCAFHNASLSAEDRFLVEDLFLKQHVLILCSTCTLAMGVNLPAHLVVIKGTKQWSADRHDYEDYDTSMILQMAGRAGRPDFDTQGFCEVLTGEGDAATVRGRVRGAEVLESHLRGGLCEALNSEVVLGTVGTVEDAVRWFKLTFCYIRMRKHPRHYRVPDKAANSPDALEEFLTTMILNRVQELSDARVLVQEDGRLRALEPGRLMSSFCVSFGTMSRAMRYASDTDMPAAVRLLASCDEFSSITLRRAEKRPLNEANTRSGRLRFPVFDPKRPDRPIARIRDRQDKFVVLLNLALTGQAEEKLEWSLRQDMELICTKGERLASCFFQLFSHKRCLALAVCFSLLSRCLAARLWEDSPVLVTQAPRVGPLLGHRLSTCGIQTLRQLAQADPRRIELAAGKPFPWGNQVKKELKGVLPPEVTVRASWTARLRGVDVRVTLSPVEDEHSAGQGRSGGATLVVGDLDADRVALCKHVNVHDLRGDWEQSCALERPLGAGRSVRVVTALLWDTTVGSDVTLLSDVPPGVSSSEGQEAREIRPTDVRPPTGECKPLVLPVAAAVAGGAAKGARASGEEPAAIECSLESAAAPGDAAGGADGGTEKEEAGAGTPPARAGEPAAAAAKAEPAVRKRPAVPAKAWEILKRRNGGGVQAGSSAGPMAAPGPKAGANVQKGEPPQLSDADLLMALESAEVRRSGESGERAARGGTAGLAQATAAMTQARVVGWAPAMASGGARQAAPSAAAPGAGAAARTQPMGTARHAAGAGHGATGVMAGGAGGQMMGLASVAGMSATQGLSKRLGNALPGQPGHPSTQPHWTGARQTAPAPRQAQSSPDVDFWASFFQQQGPDPSHAPALTPAPQAAYPGPSLAPTPSPVPQHLQHSQPIPGYGTVGMPSHMGQLSSFMDATAFFEPPAAAHTGTGIHPNFGAHPGTFGRGWRNPAIAPEHSVIDSYRTSDSGFGFGQPVTGGAAGLEPGWGQAHPFSRSHAAPTSQRNQDPAYGSAHGDYYGAAAMDPTSSTGHGWGFGPDPVRGSSQGPSHATTKPASMPAHNAGRASVADFFESFSYS